MNNNGVCVSTKTAIIVGVIFIAMIVFGIISRNKNAAYAKQMKEYVEVIVPAARAYGDSMAKIADIASVTADSAITVAQTQSAEIDRLKTRVTVLRGKNQSLADAALADTNTPPAARAAIEGLQQEVVNLNAIIVRYEELDATQKLAITNLTIARDAQKNRADSLDAIVANIPPPPGPVTIIGIKMPHIPTWVGYTAIAVGGYVVGTQVNK
jgi:hypothetical protein